MQSGPSRPPLALVLTAASALLILAMAVPIITGLLSTHLQDDLHFGDAQLGLAVSLFWACTSITSPIFGRIADRVGWRPALVTGCVMATVSVGGIVLFVGSWTSLVVWLLVSAVAYSLCSPTSNLVVISNLPARLRGRVLGLKQTSPAAIAMLGGLAIPTIAEHVGWRAVYLLIMIFVPVAVWPLVKLRPRKQHPQTRPSPEVAVVDQPGPPIPVARFALATGLGTLGIACTTTFTVRSMVEAGISVAIAGFAIALAGGLAIAVRVATSWWIDVRATTDLTAVLWLLAGSVTGLLLMALGQSWSVLAGAVLAIACGWGWPPLLYVVAISARAGSAGAAAGVIQIGTGAGQAIGPVLFGLLSALVSFRTGWILVAIASLLGMLIVWFTQRQLARAAEPPG